MKTLVYTAVIGGIDQLRDPVTPGNHQWVCYTDQIIRSRVWQTMRPQREFSDPRMTARYHKTIFANELNADLVLWQDGKITMQKDVDWFFQCISNHDIALIRHPVRNCIFEEATKVIELNKADKKKTLHQVDAYRQEHPEKAGLYETAVVVRNAKKCRGLNEAWWHEIQKHTSRDQISLPYLLRKLSVNFVILDMSYNNTDRFTVQHHPITRYQPRIPFA